MNPDSDSESTMAPVDGVDTVDRVDALPQPGGLVSSPAGYMALDETDQHAQSVKFHGLLPPPGTLRRVDATDAQAEASLVQIAGDRRSMQIALVQMYRALRSPALPVLDAWAQVLEARLGALRAEAQSAENGEMGALRAENGEMENGKMGNGGTQPPPPESGKMGDGGTMPTLQGDAENLPSEEGATEYPQDSPGVPGSVAGNSEGSAALPPVSPCAPGHSDLCASAPLREDEPSTAPIA